MISSSTLLTDGASRAVALLLTVLVVGMATGCRTAGGLAPAELATRSQAPPHTAPGHPPLAAVFHRALPETATAQAGQGDAATPAAVAMSAPVDLEPDDEEDDHDEEDGSDPSAEQDERPEVKALELDDELDAALAQAVASSEITDTLSVAVVDANGQVVFDHNGDRLRLPASSTKVITAAAVVEALGVGHRLSTKALVDGEVVDDELEGDLVLVGGGDPGLGHPEFERILMLWPRTPLEDLADQIAESVEEITGDVVADPHSWPDEPLAEGWPQRYLDQGHARRSSALTVNAGTAIVDRDGGIIARPVSDPALEAAEELIDLLEDRDVDVGGEAVRASEPRAGQHVARVQGHQLGDVMAQMLRSSDNVLADGLWRAAGAMQGDASWAGAEQWGLDVLERSGADTDGAVLGDGSGLSRDSRVSAAQLAQLDAAMARGEHADAWTDLMTAAGNSKYLRRRLAGNDADGAARAKTGTLDDVRSLAGHVVGKEGRWHFAVMADGLTGSQPWQARESTDEIVELLARHVRGCDLDGCDSR